MKNWLLVANASQARLLEETDQPGVYQQRLDLVHPASRLKGSRLGDDRAGHAPGGIRSTVGAAYDSRTDVREREHDRFARELAAVLDAGVSSGECAGLVLVVSKPFLGRLEAHLREQTRKAVLRTVANDYTRLRDDEVVLRLHERLPE